MHTYRVGKSDIHISNLTLGCMSLGTDLAKATRIIDEAIDAGINHLDTADLYDYGENERIIGQAVKNKRHEIILTSKVGNHFNEQTRTHTWDPSKAHIEKGLKDTLHRLGTDYLDIYMLHGGTIEDPIDESIEAFEGLKRAGLIRAYGISSIRPNVIREYMKRAHMDVIMMQYSLLDRRPEELLDELYENKISVLARGPFAKGILTEKASEYIAKKAANGFLDYSQAALQTSLKQLHTTGFPLQQLALDYILQHPAVTSAVFGASNVEQLHATLANSNTAHMSEEVYQQCRQVTKQSIYSAHR